MTGVKVFRATPILSVALVHATFPALLKPCSVAQGEIWYGTQLLGDDDTTDVYVFPFMVRVVEHPVFKFKTSFK